MIENPSNGECKVPVNASGLEEVWHGVINLGELRSSREMQQGNVLRVRIVVADRDVIHELAQPVLGCASTARDRPQQLADETRRGAPFPRWQSVVLELRVAIAPVKTERLREILLVVKQDTATDNMAIEAFNRQVVH